MGGTPPLDKSENPKKPVLVGVTIARADLERLETLALKQGVNRAALVRQALDPERLDKVGSEASEDLVFLGFKILAVDLAPVDELAAERGITRSQMVRQALSLLFEDYAEEVAA